MAKKAKTMALQVMYIGPSVRSLGLVSGRLYRGDYTVLLADLIKKYPLVERLIVPVSEINSAKARMKETGTAEYLAAVQIAGGEI